MIFERSDFDYQLPPIMVFVPWSTFLVVTGASTLILLRTYWIGFGPVSRETMAG